MKILSIVGKSDTRVVAYPLIRALSITGQVGVITDDGCFRRLYPGRNVIGTVNGVDIAVCGRVNDKFMHVLDNTGINYDYLVVVSSDYVPDNADGVLACHGLDRSMMTVDDEENAVDEDFLIIEKVLREQKEAADAANNQSNNSESTDKKKGRNKKVETEAIEADNPAPEEVAESTESADAADNTESLRQKLLEMQRENPDRIVIRNNNFCELQIAYAAAPKKGIAGISLKDGYTKYVYSCEEEKRLSVQPDKVLNETIAKTVSPLIGIDKAELLALLTRDETFGDPKSQKSKKK